MAAPRAFAEALSRAQRPSVNRGSGNPEPRQYFPRLWPLIAVLQAKQWRGIQPESMPLSTGVLHKTHDLPTIVNPICDA